MNANASVMDYSYSKLDVPFKKVLEGLLTKAVRVTTAVKDKIKNGYKKNFTVEGIEKQQVELISKVAEQMKPEEPKPVDSVPAVTVNTIPVVTTAEEESYLISKTVNETKENIDRLLADINQLEKQKKVINAIKRVALYTPELLKLTFDKAKKWFGDFYKIVDVADAVMPKVVQETPTPSIMPNNPVTPTPVPTIEPTPTPVSTIEPKVEAVSAVKSFNWDELLNSVKPKEEAVQAKPELNANEMPITGINEFKFEIPSFEQRVEPQKVSPAVSTELPGFELKPAIPRSNVLLFEKKDDNSFSADKKDGFPTRGEVTARLYRLGETIKEKSGQISKLSAELEAVKAEKAEANKKVAAYDQVNSSLSSKIISLTEQLTSANADLEKAKEMRSQILKSHEEEITQMKADFDLAMAKATEEKTSLIASYESKLSAAESKYRADLAKLNADYKDTMQTIYAGMQNIQGIDDTSMSRTEPQDDEYGLNTTYSYEEPVRRMVA